MIRDLKLLVLLLVGSLTTMVGGVVAPILPEIVQHLHIHPGLAGILVNMHCLTIALFSPLLGILADRVGRLRVLIPSLLLYALVGTAGAFMESFWPLLATRALLGAASGGIAAASLGLLASMYEGDARSQALGQATSALTIAGILFPLLGGWVGATHWQFTFYLYGLALPLALLTASIFRKNRSLHPQAKAVESSQNLRQVLGHPYVLWLLLTLSLASIAMSCVVIYAPLYLKVKIGASTILNGIVLASRAIGAAGISAFGASKLAKNIGVERSTAIGFGLMAVTLGTIPLLSQIDLILLTAVLFGVGFGIVVPNLYSALASVAPAKMRSSVLAAGTGAGFLGQFFCPLLLGVVLTHSNLESVFYTAASISLVAGLLLILVATTTLLVKPTPPEA
ncbi:MFS transporter [Nostocaceae cyanobacterium CENA369]|uniref:MFS transporter n=1 Tax=Dendronalium phyllosphericum CENA369 TaxID=1725256 RepID=A0A8J7HZL4_9NOST|nr:MFS transporter [Dendronalium phyllosphericum]MBH8573240.1 MFS transporter [Dendronalium phyllosphericum CENA369]